MQNKSDFTYPGIWHHHHHNYICVFSMLTNLDVYFVSVDVLLALLQKSPVLKILALKGIHEFAEERLNSAVVPKCFASLEDVKFDIDGVQHELFLAKFFMENCMMLQRIALLVDSRQDAEVLKEYEEKLYSFGSLNLVCVEFYVSNF
ncbi:uncharacterized protein [Medicago truncatula]|uniref:uncharacterized protein n=1 Tax=Medicago truncatula TaxID=3880 RepID=UPI000D2F1EC8|nr:uncharacterized protein LOC11427876 [Medicago truncatula]